MIDDAAAINPFGALRRVHGVGENAAGNDLVSVGCKNAGDERKCEWIVEGENGAFDDVFPRSPVKDDDGRLR
jgi:hypothetical protein